MFKHTFIRRSVVAGLAIGAAGLPAAAQARFIGAPQSGSVASQPAQLVSAPALQPPSSGAQSGFEWADAGIGAAGALVLIGVGSGAAVALRRRTGPLAG